MFTESEHILKEALGTFTKLYGEESAEVAEVLNHLGGTYYKYSQLQKSRYANSRYKCMVQFIAYCNDQVHIE